MDEVEAGLGEGTSRTVATEKGAMLEALRDLLYEIPGFQALAERGIPRELISTLCLWLVVVARTNRRESQEGVDPSCGKQGPAAAQVKGNINF